MYSELGVYEPCPGWWDTSLQLSPPRCDPGAVEGEPGSPSPGGRSITLLACTLEHILNSTAIFFPINSTTYMHTEHLRTYDCTVHRGATTW